ncbi:hypothetical protein FQN60_011149 [Etheostoma spectabile]|uniref:Interleukin-1 receptor accessory protein-like 1 n=1 Tax=Etheostoma spectabile TaxID=54343 RepID=A0A5J5DS22_9PERO|nr:hypothetical protein FQN60_011149 [Etheostoma spectabile]
MDLTNNVPSAEQRQMGMLIHERSLVILSASVNHQGNYSCTQRNASAWFRLTVVTTQSREYKERFQYPATRYTNEAFTLHCPDVNVPAENIPNITSNGIIWHKEGKPSPVDSYFTSVEEKDRGVYTCTRSYLCYDKSGQSVIVSPRKSGVFHVDLGSPKVIDCKAVLYSDFDEVFWLSGKSLVETDNSLPVFSNYTREKNDGEINMTASLVFKKVSEEDLSKNYTCKLESVSGHSSFVTINLAQKLSFFSLSLTLGIVCVVVVTVVAVVVYMKLKMDTSAVAEAVPDCIEQSCTVRQCWDQVCYQRPYSFLTRLDTVSPGRAKTPCRPPPPSGGSYKANDVFVKDGEIVALYCPRCIGNASAWFRLTVVTTQSREYKERFQYPARRYTEEAFTLHCPDVNVPAENIPNITSNGIIWHKEGKPSPVDSYFTSLEEKDRGVYTCTRSYQCYDKTGTDAAIREPQHNHVFYVDLGSPKVIDCKAVMFSDLDDLFWLSGKSIVKMANSSPVFYNYTRSNTAGKIKMTASLVFKKVSEEDLSTNYTCKLDSVSEHSSFVTIHLAQKPRPSYLSLALGIVGVVVVMVLTVVIYVRFKINITLFLRDTIGCHSSTSDGKSYDAFLICYKSSTDAGLHENDRKGLESVLEERFGYSLCLYDRDILPGKAVAEAVLDCMEQSRTVVLVPSHAAPCPGSGLLSVIHEALVERQTRLVFIKTESTDVLGSGLLPEALQLLGEAGHCVTWKGENSMPASSSFWKQLRYYLPSPQRAPRTRLLPQTVKPSQ